MLTDRRISRFICEVGRVSARALTEGALRNQELMASESGMRHSLLVESKPSAVNDICEQILSRLEQSGYNKEDVFAVHLAIEEAFVNAVKHGNKMDASRTVKIEYAAGPEEIEIWLTDEGAGFDPESVPDPRSGQNIYKPEGRGLLLIRSYMDEVSFNDQGNSIRMVRYKHRPGAVEGERVEGT